MSDLKKENSIRSIATMDTEDITNSDSLTFNNSQTTDLDEHGKRVSSDQKVADYIQGAGDSQDLDLFGESFMLEDSFAYGESFAESFHESFRNQMYKRGERLDLETVIDLEEEDEDDEHINATIEDLTKKASDMTLKTSNQVSVETQ